ncbi:MAG TPA: branched-chain amino acid ABC transporter permease [Stellaceae bacterium]|nr:branched-chain amino acid ABC transporter permease [Stellaceae bacterium]
MSARWLVLAAAVALLAAVPWFGNAVLIQFGINALLVAVLAQSWNILGGFAGYVSFGNSVFYGLGSYGVAIAMAQWNLPFWAGLMVAAFVAVAFAALLGWPILRLRGPYFAIVTLGISAAMSALAANLDIAGKNVGLILPLTRADTLFYEGSLVLLAAATLTVAWIAHSRFGMALIAIREDEDAAGSVGVNATRFKIAALAMAAFFTALAGGIHAYWITYIDPAGSFDTTLDLRMVIMTMFGGPGTVLGPVVGALVLSAIYEVLADSISTAAALFFGIVILVAVIFLPRGLVDLGGGFRTMGWRYFFANIRQYRI